MTATRSGGTLRADLGLLRQHRFARLFAGRTIAMFGTGFGPIAIAFGVLALPGATPATLSVVLIGHAVPQLGLILLGGVISDRLPRHRVLVSGQLMTGLAYGAMAAMLLAGWAPLLLLTGCGFLAGSASALLLPALTRVIPEVVDREQLQPANALLRLGSNGANIAGLAGAGVAVALLGPGAALASAAATCFGAAALLAGLRGPGSPPGDRRPRQLPGGWLRTDLREGLREFGSRQWLWTVVVSAAFLNAGTAAAFGVLGPALAHARLGGAVPWSLIMIGYAAGTLVSVLAALRLRPVRPLLVAALVTPLLAGPLLALGFAAPLALVVVAGFGAGAAFNVFGVLWETTVQRQVPTAALARVISCNYLVALSLKPVGLLLAGQAAASFGAGPTVLALGGLLLVAGLAPLCSPQVRQLTTGPATDHRPGNSHLNGD